MRPLNQALPSWWPASHLRGPFRASSFTPGLHPPGATAQRFIASLVEAVGVLIVDRSSISSSRFVAHTPLNHSAPACRSMRPIRRPRTTAKTCHRLRVNDKVGLGGKKAAMAVAHKILVMVYHLLAEGTLYDEERCNRLSPQQEERHRSRAVQALQALGYRVT
jgi:hypothetical protein